MPRTQTTHETAFNYALGEVLQNMRGGWKNRVKTEMNHSLVHSDGGQGRADNLIYPDDMQPVVIEAAFENTADIDGDAIKRLGTKETEMRRDIMTAVAVRIPARVRDIPDNAGIRKWLQSGATLEYAVYSFVPGIQGDSPAKPYDIRYPDGKPNSGWISGTARDLADLIELAATPDRRIKHVAENAGGAVRGIGAEMYNALNPKIRAIIAKKVGQPADVHAMRVAACVWLNALSLHSKLAAARPGDIDSPAQCKTLNDMANAWEAILKIDYHSVFLPALASLKMLSDNQSLATTTLQRLREQVDAINGLRLGGVADVSSDMFPELATDRKITAAYYTRMEVAELLAGLAFNLIPDNGDELKIADFACGTGALLKAAYRQVRRRASAKKTDLDKLHKTYMEECLHGADIQPIAAHLTAAGLAGMRPQTEYEHSNVICADIRDGKSGSLDLLKVEALQDLFGVDSAEGVDGGKYAFSPADNSFHLCIMNPPYTRSRGGNVMFGVEGLPEYQRKKSVSNLRHLLKDSFADMQAGMASAFCYLADKKLKHNGVLATVLPLSAAGQDSWRPFRAHIMQNYSDITIIGMATQKLKSFSADTGMGEMLLVARKTKEGDGDRNITFANLHRLPRDFVEAHEIARALRHTEKSEELKIGGHVFATCVKLSSKNGEPWGAAGAKEHEIAIIAEKMTRGIFVAPGLVEERAFNISMSPLLPHVGPTHHKIGHLSGNQAIGAFTFRDWRRGDNVNLALWKADYKTQTQLVCAPTHRGELMRGERDLAKKMLEQQSTLFISRGLGMASQKLAGAMTKTPCMGGTGWNGLQCPEESRAAYCLWLNSVLGLICRWQCGGRQHPGRARMQLVNLKNFPAPNFCAEIPEAKNAVKIANKEFPRLAEMTLMPCSYAWRDDARKEIDCVVLNMLGIKATEEQMQALRETWCREPSVHGGNKTIIKTLHDDKLL